MACVVPKDDCPHVQKIELDTERVNTAAPCVVCQDRQENWLCTGCYGVFCSRYVQGHMRKHNEETSHPIALSFSDLSLWCYECDAYVSQASGNIVFHAHMLKHKCPPGAATADAEEMEQVRNLVFGVSDDVEPQYIFYDDKNAEGKEKGEKEKDREEGKGHEKEKEAGKKRSHGEDKIEDTKKSNTTSTSTTSTEQSGAPTLVEIEGLSYETILANKVIDRILGCIYGNALGDAVGLATEFLNKAQIKKIYGNKPINFPNYVQNMHNSRWKAGDWTDDTDQMILILDTILETGKADDVLYAKKLQHWIYNGFPELGDTAGCGLGALTANVTHHPKFLTNPSAAAYDAWNSGGRVQAPNGGVMRTSIVGCKDFDNLDSVIKTADTFCKVTHADPRCIASCRAIVIAIAFLLQEAQRQNHLHPAQKEEEVAAATLAQIRAHTHELLREVPPHLHDFEKYLTMKTLEELELDASEKIGYTFKAMGCGFWGLRTNLSFEEALEALTKEGGDADTNGAVCGAVIGCKIGYSALPTHWLRAMPNKKWLDEKVVRFLRHCGHI